VDSWLPETLVTPPALASACPSSSVPTTYFRDRDDQDRQHHEAEHADQLGDQQPGAPDGAHPQVAQRALLRLPRDRLPGGDRDRDRQEERQHDRQRGQREERAVGEDGRQERRTSARARAEVGQGQ